MCRICCGGELSVRADDQDEAAIGKTHDIYYDTEMGTTAGINYFKERITLIVRTVLGDLGLELSATKAHLSIQGALVPPKTNTKM